MTRQTSMLVRQSPHVMLGGWVFGALAFAAVVAVVLRRSEIAEIERVVRHVRPIWLLAGLLLQSGTYACAAAVWRVALTRAGYPSPTLSLLPLALGMLFTNQAVPSGGLSGSALVLKALRRRRIPENVAMGALLVGLVTTSAAYLLALGASMVVLAVYQVVDRRLLIVVALFAAASGGVPAVILWYTKASASSRAQARLAQVPGVGPVLHAIATAPAGLLRDPGLLAHTIAWQLAELALDAATLYVMLVAIGVWVPPSTVFASFVMAYAAARIVPTPLGLGTFEGASIAMLRLVGVEIEAALAATLLLRGLTVWLPMLPGLWCARWVLKARPEMPATP